MFGDVGGVENFLQDVEGLRLSFSLGQPSVFRCQGQCGQLKADPGHADDRTVGGIPHHASVCGHRSQRTERTKLTGFEQCFILRLKDPRWTLRADFGKDRWQGTCHGQECSQHVFTILSP